jgi:hypothetical protein
MTIRCGAEDLDVLQCAVPHSPVPISAPTLPQTTMLGPPIWMLANDFNEGGSGSGATGAAFGLSDEVE